MRQKIKKFDLVFVFLGVAFVVCALFLPKSGKFALLDVAADCIILLGIAIYLFLKIRKLNGGIKKNLYVFVVSLLFALFGLLSTKSMVMDAISGPKEIELHNVHLSKLQGIKGIITLNYYLQGSDSEGKDYEIEISSDVYYHWRKTETIDITYYKNTKRLYELGGGK